MGKEGEIIGGERMINSERESSWDKGLEGGVVEYSERDLNWDL